MPLPPVPPVPTNTEKTFGDRLARGRTMQSKIATFAPAFAPDDAALAPAAFDTFLDSVKDKNDAVAKADSAFAVKTGTRKTLYELIKTRTLRVVDTISGNEAWKQYLPKVKESARMVRNSRPSKTSDEPAPPNAPAKPKRKTGQQSFGDIDIWFGKLIEAVKLIPGYAPPVSSNIQIVQLETLLTDYRAANKDVATTGATLSNLRRERLALYDGEAGSLSAKMKAVKKATGGQYGRDSAQFAEVKSIAL
jgi:hypothetical protein